MQRGTFTDFTDATLTIDSSVGLRQQATKPKTNMDWLDHRIDEIRVKL